MKAFKNLNLRQLSTAIILGMSAFVSPFVGAIPAKPGLITVSQPDGSTLQIRLIGDEFNHQCFSSDGYLLIEENGTYFFADIDEQNRAVSIGIKAIDPAHRSAEARKTLDLIDRDNILERLNEDLRVNNKLKARQGPGLSGKSYFPATGQQKAIVILVEYTDVRFHNIDNYEPHDYFSRMMMEPGFSSFGGTGSARDFFIESSDGRFLPEFDVYGPVTLSKNRAYYGANGITGNDSNAHWMAIEACQQLDDTVDFSQYDRDNDGYIDNVFIFYAGEGEHAGAPSDAVWPHAYQVSGRDANPYIFDGVRLDRYGCTCEWITGRPDGVGTFVHEFSHVLGLPDLYTTDYNSAFTPGSWSTLDAGPYNNNGCTPPLYSSFERYALGWMEPIEITSATSATLSPLQCNMGAIIPTGNDNEFFLLENRQRQGWDEFLPNSGMLVWHVDYNRSIWYSNTVNNNPTHQYVDLEEADNLQTESSREGDSFPGSNGITSFTDNTNPSMRTWANKSLNLPITDIEEKDGLIYFNVLGGVDPIDAPLALEPEEADHEGFTAIWQPAGNNVEYLLNVYTKEEDGEIYYLDGYYRKNVGKETFHKLTDLIPSTKYYYTVIALKGVQASEPSREQSVITERMPLDKLKAEALEATDITATGFTANWLGMDEADDYLLDLYTKLPDGNLEDTCDFFDFPSELPQGWMSTSPTAYSMSTYSGEAAPALRMSANGDTFSSPYYKDGVKGLSFWHRGSATTDKDAIIVETYADNVWTQIASLNITTDKGGKTTEILNISPDTEAIRLIFNKHSEKGNLALDDVKILHGVKYTPQYIEEYTKKSCGNALSIAIKGLNPDTEYYYRLTASDGSRQSRPSEEIAVRTSKSSAVSETYSDMPFISVSGHMLTISGLNSGEKVSVYDVAGLPIFEKITENGGTIEFMLPSAGCYVVQCNNMTSKYKIIVK